jgi:hypothetical protein
MTSAAETGLRVVAFSSLDGGLWGAALDNGVACLMLGLGESRVSGGPQTTILDAEQLEWRLTGEGVALTVVPLGSAAPGPGPQEPSAATQAQEAFTAAGSQAPSTAAGAQEPSTAAGAQEPSTAAGAQETPTELCRVRGQVTLEGKEHAVDGLGVRSRQPSLQPRGLDSLRGVWGWFEDQQALALLSARPAGASDQEHDHLDATMFEALRPTPVADPRLSTTYDADGLPARVGLELWIGEGDQQYPQRAAGEAVGPGQELVTEGATVRVLPLRCHSSGLDGPGVYLLARF